MKVVLEIWQEEDNGCPVPDAVSCSHLCSGPTAGHSQAHQPWVGTSETAQFMALLGVGHRGVGHEGMKLSLGKKQR